MRYIGLHMRLNDSILNAVSQALSLGTPIFQCFLIDQEVHRLITVDQPTIRTLNELRSQFQKMYIHGSYWINLAGFKKRVYNALMREISLAKQLGCFHLILHPGSASHINNHTERIYTLADVLNRITNDEPAITFILENTAHGSPSVGSNFEDFYQLKQRLEQPNRIRFCIDTAHAHAYGYDLSTPDTQNKFINLIDQTVGIENIELIHLNDSAHPCGSQLDKHAVIGDGLIGDHALQSFALDHRLVTIPLILELPMVSPECENSILQKVRSWHQL